MVRVAAGAQASSIEWEIWRCSFVFVPSLIRAEGIQRALHVLCAICTEARRAFARSTGFRFSVFTISIPQLRTHAGVVAGSRLVRRDLYSVCFSSAPPTTAGSAPRQDVFRRAPTGCTETKKTNRLFT